MKDFRDKIVFITGGASGAGLGQAQVFGEAGCKVVIADIRQDHLEEAMALAQNLAGKSPLGLRLTKEALDRNIGAAALEDAIRLEDRNQAMCIAQLASQIKK